jgi:hypothetical protein
MTSTSSPRANDSGPPYRVAITVRAAGMTGAPSSPHSTPSRTASHRSEPCADTGDSTTRARAEQRAGAGNARATLERRDSWSRTARWARQPLPPNASAASAKSASSRGLRELQRISTAPAAATRVSAGATTNNPPPTRATPSATTGSTGAPLSRGCATREGPGFLGRQGVPLPREPVQAMSGPRAGPKTEPRTETARGVAALFFLA